MTARRLAFALVIAGEAVFLGMILVGGAMYPGYDHARQYISELGATGAPTGPPVSGYGFLPSGVLLTAFCLLAAWRMRGRPVGALGALLLAFYAFGLINSAAFPCNFECDRAEVTFSQFMHDLVGGTGYLAGGLGVLLVGLSALESGARWLAPLAVVCAAVAAAGFAVMAAEVEYLGAAQRALEAALAVFLVAFGWALGRGRIG